MIDEPDWLRDAWRTFAHEWSGYVRAAISTTFTPRQFLRQWATGERPPVNPLVCLLNALGIVTIINALQRVALPRPSQLPDWYDLVAPAIQLVNAAALASLIHFPLKLLGGRGRWRTSVAVALFVSAGPMVPVSVVRDLVQPISVAAPARADLLVLLPVLAIFALYLVAALAGAHRVALWRAVVALLMAAALVVGLSVAQAHVVAAWQHMTIK